jgi:iron(III) transport system substrate-binding protein
VAAGEVAFGLTDTDDAFGALQDGAPVAVVFPDQEGIGSLVMPTTTLLIRGGPHPENGRRLIDFLLSPEVEQRMAKAAAHLPVRPGIDPPQGLPSLQDIRAMAVDYGRVMEEMERIQPLLRAWVGL